MNDIERFHQVLNIDYDTQLCQLIIDEPYNSDDLIKLLARYLTEVLAQGFGERSIDAVAEVRTKTSCAPRTLAISTEDGDYLSLRSAAAYLGIYQVHIQELMGEGVVAPACVAHSPYGYYIPLFAKTSLQELLPRIDSLRAAREQRKAKRKDDRRALKSLIRHFGELPSD